MSFCAVANTIDGSTLKYVWMMMFLIPVISCQWMAGWESFVYFDTDFAASPST